MKQSHISIIAIVLAIMYCLGLISTACDSQVTEIQQTDEAVYQERIFDPSVVHTIDIQVAEQSWNTLKSEAFSKECIDSTVLVDGEEICHVGVRTKGNSTLLLNAAKGWDRFSLVLEFDAFQESQRYYGLDELSLYNNMFDASYMKTFLCYEMMRSMGLPTPLCSFSAVYLNGEYIGLYAASENFSQSFAVRNFGYEYGNIYKPEHLDIASILTGKLQNARFNLAALTEDGAESITIDSFFSIPNDAVRLAYIGDSLYDYEDIWRNASFPIGTSDKRRLVNALRCISEDDGAENVLDIDSLARYFAVNTFVLNTDCYTTSMTHNYGLYEKDGILSMLPWDYDVALGNIGSEFGVADPTAYINQPIDTPVSGTTVEERPILNALLSSREGLRLYHQYLDQLLNEWIENGYLKEQITSLAEMIRPWAEQDSTSVYSLESHEKAVQSIIEFSEYRGQSIRGQLEGTIASTADAQAAAPQTLIDCSAYAPPDSGIMTVLLPDSESTEVTPEAILRLLPSVHQHITGNVLALLNMVDWKHLPSSEELSAIRSSEHSGLDKELLIAAIKPYAIQLVKILLGVLAIPIVLFFGFWFVKHWGRKKGGIHRVI